MSQGCKVPGGGDSPLLSPREEPPSPTGPGVWTSGLQTMPF